MALGLHLFSMLYVGMARCMLNPAGINPDTSIQIRT